MVAQTIRHSYLPFGTGSISCWNYPFYISAMLLTIHNDAAENASNRDRLFCPSCLERLAIPVSSHKKESGNPPNATSLITCQRCGFQFKPYAVLKDPTK